MMKKTSEEHGGHTGEGPLTSTTLSEAEAMLVAFASVGATHFDVTMKNEQTGEVWFDRGRTISMMIGSLPSLFARAGSILDIIVRPHGQNTRSFIQLDDLTAIEVQKVRDFAFAIIETSHENYQAWLYVTDADEMTARRLRELTSADLHASGAVRLCGTLNHKPKYAPHFPAVRLIEAHSGRMTKIQEIEAGGLSFNNGTMTSKPPRAPILPRFHSRTFPDYDRCLGDAPLRHRGQGPDISRADWQFALIAADRGFTADEITAELMRRSEKASQEGYRYAERTARRAVESVQKLKP